MHTMFTLASLSNGPSNANFCRIPYPLGECQPALGIKFTGDYLILSSNLLLLHEKACISLPHMMLPILLPMLTGIPLDSNMTPL